MKPVVFVTKNFRLWSHIQNSDVMSVESHIPFVPNVRSSNSIVHVVERLSVMTNTYIAMA